MSVQDRDSRATRLADLLLQTIEAHHQYELEELDGGTDTDWPTWYAAYLLRTASLDLLPNSITEQGASELARRLTQADKSHRANAPDMPWQDYYANYLLQSRGA